MISAAARNLRIAASPLVSLPPSSLAFANRRRPAVAEPTAKPFLMKERRFARLFKPFGSCAMGIRPFFHWFSNFEKPVLPRALSLECFAGHRQILVSAGLHTCEE